MASGDQWSPMPPFWTQAQANRTQVANLDTGRGIVLPHEPADLDIDGGVEFSDSAPIGGSGPRSVFSHTGPTTVSFRVMYSRFDLTHRTGDAAKAMANIQTAIDWWESARFPVDAEDGWEGSTAPLLMLSIPNVLDMICHLRRLRMQPSRDVLGQIRRVILTCTFQETLARRYTTYDVYDVGFSRVEQ